MNGFVYTVVERANFYTVGVTTDFGSCYLLIAGMGSRDG